jgi:hypothetical protein
VYLIFSILLITLGFFIPYIFYRLFKKRYGFIVFMSMSPLLQIVFVSIGVQLSKLYINHLFLTYLIFIICIFNITVQVYFLIFLACKEIVLNFVLKDDWGMGKKHVKIILLVAIMIGLAVIPTISFSTLYFFWGTIFDDNFNLQLGDIIYFAFGITYSLPLHGVLDNFQFVINSNGVLRWVQILHVVTSKLIEWVMIGLVISKLFRIIEERLAK